MASLRRKWPVFLAVFPRQYRAEDRPWYRLGHGVVLAYICAGLICTAAFALYLSRENRIRDAGGRDEVIEGVDNKNAHERNGRYKSVEEARIHKGDQWSGFRYTM